MARNTIKLQYEQKMGNLLSKYRGAPQSIKTAQVAFYVVIDRLSRGKWRKPMPAVREVIYELRQMFNSRFLNETQFS